MGDRDRDRDRDRDTLLRQVDFERAVESHVSKMVAAYRLLLNKHETITTPLDEDVGVSRHEVMHMEAASESIVSLRYTNILVAQTRLTDQTYHNNHTSTILSFSIFQPLSLFSSNI
jgi:hypothetical protein